ncbi:zinc finger protein ZFP2-like [Palaemon carinicauda]|uniref:zinc finger protein ZFP2-like n=1 Tax=Palaemon carinicauda TaxID=392227 RepID=UPI0035B57CF6
MMSSSDRGRMKNPESLEFPIKSEVEDSFSHNVGKVENNIFVCDGLFDDSSPFVDPDLKFKAKPEFKQEPEIEFKEESEIFDSSDDMKYPYDCDASVNKEDLQISEREINKEEESVNTGVKVECGIQLGSSRNEDKGIGRGKEKECLQKEEQIGSSGCKKPLCQESDSKAHTDVGTRKKSFLGENYEKLFSEVVNSNTLMVIHTGGQFRCKECGQTFSNKVDHKAHYETHTRKKAFKCSVCDKVFSKSSNFTTHFRIHTGEKPFKCSDCDKSFSEKAKLNNHYKIHTGEKPFKCSVCDKAFSQRINLTIHYNIHTDKSFKCTVCDKTFTQLRSLTRHHKLHTVEKPFKCSVCNKTFSQKYTLTDHYRIHTGVKPFKCSICDKSFSMKSSLQNHFRTHTGEKPYKCSVCDKTFSQRFSLNSHYRTHTGAKPFKCSVCDKAFSQRSNLTTHYRIHTRSGLTVEQNKHMLSAPREGGTTDSSFMQIQKPKSY